MLAAVVLHLQAVIAGQIQGSAARAVHGFWLNQWQAAAPAVGDSLHQTTGVQPFTLSPLMGLPRPQHGVSHFAAGQSAWLRLTTLHHTLSQPLLQNWLLHLPAQIELAGSQWAIQTIALNPAQHPWAGQSSYDQLMSPSLSPSADTDTWTLEFHTPTTFRSGQTGQLPFPLPDSLLNSWLRRWQACAPAELALVPDDIRPRLREGLHVSAYDLKTVPVRHGRRLEIGCVGQITLNGRTLRPDEKALITCLARYAFYCGSGRHTTQGMGQTRLTIND